MKDIVSVSESTSWKKVTSVQAKYNALGCQINKLSGKELNTVVDNIKNSMNKYVIFSYLEILIKIIDKKCDIPDKNKDRYIYNM